MDSKNKLSVSTVTVNDSQIADFCEAVWDFYRHSGRNFPWRNSTDPYKVLVSEMMLQQTQTDRVIPKFSAWIERFPTVSDVATASLADVLSMWSGLGYNRRVKFLHECCIRVVESFGGVFPQDVRQLESLPGIGSYTARAVSTFAYNRPEVFIETNIRSVFIFTFFPEVEKVADSQLLPLIEASVDQTNPREWYYALMDYGAALKKTVDNPSRSSRHYTKQSPFKGSLREARGAVLRVLSKKRPESVRPEVIAELEQIDYNRIIQATISLVGEGFIVAQKDSCGYDAFVLID